MSQTKESTQDIRNDIAVIGISGRFPGAKNISEFWENLKNGCETIKHFTDEELEPYEYNYEALRNNPNYVKSRGILDDIDKIDAAFFSLNPKEAAIIDPQQRIWLEVAWEALEISGYSRENNDILIGVFAGSGYNNYIFHNVLQKRSDIEDYVRFRGPSVLLNALGNDCTYLPTRTSYKFNLKGPSIAVQTACSTSLVTIAMACQSLLNYESDICIAGGICIAVPQETGYIYQRDAIFSKDGHCRPFDAEAGGALFSNGAGAVILKRMEEAIEDRDNILAVIKGYAINNDGSNKMSFTAPSVDGQAQAIAAAQSMAGVHPETITYIEAHGTGTPLGDPIEIAALSKVFRSKTNAKQFCGIGSVKSNIGHLDAASGVAGFIKAVLALQHKQIPPTLFYKKPNPEIDFKDSPFYVVDKLTDWNPKGFPRRVGVNSSGFGGTNAFVILEEAPELFTDVKSRPYQLLVLSAKTESALDASTKNLELFIKQNPNLSIPDIAYTLANGRRGFDYRCFIVGSIEDLKLTADASFNSVIKGKVENNAIDRDFKNDVIDLLKKPYNENTDWESLLYKVGELWLSGLSIDWEAFYSNEKRRFIELPTYPFEKKRYWIDPPENETKDSVFSRRESDKEMHQNTAAYNTYEYVSCNDETLNERKDKISVLIKDELIKLSEMHPQEINVSTSFVNYGFDSIFLAGFAVSLENVFKINVMFRQLITDYPNIKQLAEYIESELSLHKLNKVLPDNIADTLSEPRPKFKNLAPIQPAGNKIPFILVHGDDANNMLLTYLDKDQPFYGYFHQSADGESMKYRTVESIADYYLNELLIARPHGPYILSGFSFGGLVAYEMAQKIIAKGERVDLFVMIDTFFPQAIGSLDSTKKKLSLYILLRKLFYGLPLRIYNFIIKKTVCLIYLHYKKPIPVNLRSYYILDIYYKISPKYFPKPLDCSMLFFCAEHSEFVDANKLWKNVVMKNMYVHKIPGDHLSMISNPDNFKVLAEILKEYLKKVGK